MSATEPPSSPDPETRNVEPSHQLIDTTTTNTDPTEVQNDFSKADSSRIHIMSPGDIESRSGSDDPPNLVAGSSTIAAQPQVPSDQEPLTGQIERLSLSANIPEDSTSSADASPPPPPEKDHVFLNTSSTPATLPPINTNINPSPEKELPGVPGAKDLEPKKNQKYDGTRDDSDSQPEIQNIMGQFHDPMRSTDQSEIEIMSPRLEFAEQFMGGPAHYKPRKSSLDHHTSTEAVGSPVASAGDQPGSRPHKPDSPVSNRRSSSSTVPPLPEPEPNQTFDFHRFLEQLRHRTADPVAKFLRSFLMEFGKKQWMVHEQVKIISDFLTFITNKMAQCEIWRDVSDIEFDNAKEGMEKLVMNRLYSQTFAPAIPAPPTIPRSASRSRRRELERLHGPWRRGQHQEDIERDDILAQKIRIYSWIDEGHLDIPTVDGGGRRFLNLAQQEISKINGYRAPRDKVICILNCCKVIFGLLKNTKKADTSADSFIPLLIYVVLHANPDHLVSNIQYILRFRNQDKLCGEAGYYISSLSGAITFIETLDRTSLTVSDEEFERNVEAAVSAIAQQNHETETFGEPPSSQSLSSHSQGGESRNQAPQSSDDESSAPVAGLLRTIQKPLSSIGRIFSDEPDSSSSASQDRLQPVSTPQPGAGLSPNVYLPPRESSEEGRRSGDDPSHSARRSGSTAKKNPTRRLNAQDAAARQASAEDAEARRIQRSEHNNIVETLSNMFPNLDRDVISDVVKIKEGRVGLAVDACLALSTE